MMNTEHELCEISFVWTGLLGLRGKPTYRLVAKNVSTGLTITESDRIEQDDAFLRGEAALQALVQDLKNKGWALEGDIKNIRQLIPLSDKVDGDVIRLKRPLAVLPLENTTDTPKKSTPTSTKPAKTQNAKATSVSDVNRQGDSLSAKKSKQSSSVPQKSSAATRQPFMNVACYIRGCKNPVIGQCSGYSSSCGRFYCAEHSTGTLCGVCNDVQQANIKDQLMKEIWERETQKLMRRRTFLGCLVWPIYSIYILLVLPSALCSLGYVIFDYEKFREIWSDNFQEVPSKQVTIIVVIIVVLIALLLFMMVRNLERPKGKIRDIDALYPGFEQYFLEYKKARFNNNVGMLLDATFNALEESSRNADIERKARKIAEEEVEKELNRRGYD